MSKIPEPFENRMRLTDEQCAAIDARVGDPNYQPRKVEWLDPGDDPFDMEWRWIEPSRSEEEMETIEAGTRTASGASTVVNAIETAIGANSTSVASIRTGRSTRTMVLWRTGLAASILLAVFATWAIYAGGGQGQLREHPIAAWVTERLEQGKDGLRITAPAEDEKGTENPLINHLDRPGDVQRPSTPNLYAPVRVQEQLVIPDLPPVSTSGMILNRPMRTLVETVRPGSLFYLEASTAATPSLGSAVVVRARSGTWRLLWDEIMVSPVDGTCYFGPIKMEDEGADYFVIMADRSSSPLLRAVNPMMPTDGTNPTELDSWKARMAIALKRDGRSWFGIQRIQVRPTPGEVSPR